MHRNTTSKNVRDQQGVVSIMVTLIMMIVITLIVLGFAEVARTEQRNSLDDQLSTEAYYAAESAVNDARAVLDNRVANSLTLYDKPGCGNDANYNFGTGVVDPNLNIAYTCLLITVNPTVLQETIGYNSTVIPIIPSGSAFGKLDLSWGPGGGLPATSAGCLTVGTPSTTFKTKASWGCNYPVVRIDMVPTSTLNRNTWSANTATFFYVPYAGGAYTGNADLAMRGATVPVSCTSQCTAHIIGMGVSDYYIRVTTIYQSDVSMSIQSGNKGFAGAQAQIDATGRAQDVLRRILVSADLTDANANTSPSAALITNDSVCKRFEAADNFFAVPTDTAGMNSGTGVGGNPLCVNNSYGSPLP